MNTPDGTAIDGREDSVPTAAGEGGSNPAGAQAVEDSAADVGLGSRRRPIYPCSKAKHAGMWRVLAKEFPIEATWINTEPGEWPPFWDTCIQEAARSTVVLYCEPGDELKGAIVEAGACLGAGGTVHVVGDPEGLKTARHHPRVFCWALTNLREALQAIVAEQTAIQSPAKAPNVDPPGATTGEALNPSQNERVKELEEALKETLNVTKACFNFFNDVVPSEYLPQFEAYMALFKVDNGFGVRADAALNQGEKP